MVQFIPFRFPRSIVRALVFAIVALGSATTLSAQTLAWNASAESNLAGYRVQYGTVSGSPTTTIDVGRVTSWRIAGVQSGLTYYFRVVAYNTAGQTSVPSVQVSYTVPGTPTAPSPTLTSVSPTSGPTAGGTTITLTGTNFASGATVRVGGVAATSVTFASSTRLTARTPAGTVGAKDVVVTNPSGRTATRAGGFTYTGTSSGTLTATAVSPNTGPTSGGTAITVSGTGFVSGATVLIGGTPATSVSVASSTLITARTPAKPAGGYSVQVRNPNGQTANTPSGFLYAGTSTTPTTTLTATAVSPNTGSTSGGMAITVTGTGFVSGATVLVGGTPATSVSVASSTRITARTPAKPAGGYPVQVRNPNGQTANTPHGILYTSGTSAATATTAAALDAAVDGVEAVAADGSAAAARPRGLITRFLAEGIDSEQMHTQLAIANPEDAAAHVQLTFMTSAGAVTRRTVDVPARSRRTLDLRHVPELAGTSFSTVLESDRVVALDRRVSLDPAGRATIVAAAVDEPSPTWYFADGPTSAPFEQFYLVLNPGDADTQVQIRYLPPDGAEPVDRTYTVAAHSRTTIWVDREAPELASARVGAEITSLDGAPIVVERTVYTTQAGSAQPRSGVTHAGATSVDGPSDGDGRRGSRWLVADAQPDAVGGATSSVVVANEGPETEVVVTLLFEDGPEVRATFPVAAGSRLDVPLADAFPTAAGRRFSVLVEGADATASLVVGRAISSQAAGGADGAATRLP
jgi:hypothetical protein